MSLNEPIMIKQVILDILNITIYGEYQNVPLNSKSDSQHFLSFLNLCLHWYVFQAFSHSSLTLNWKNKNVPISFLWPKCIHSTLIYVHGIHLTVIAKISYAVEKNLPDTYFYPSNFLWLSLPGDYRSLMRLY